MSRFQAPASMTGTDPSAAQVSAAVMAVLREMAGARQNASPQDTTRLIDHGVNGFAGRTSAIAEAASIVFPGKLLLERHAASLPDSTRQLVTSPSTVVTPLAREILRKRGVLVRIATVPNAGSPDALLAGEWGVVRLCESPQAQSLEAMLVGRGGEGWVGFGQSADAAVDWLDSQTSGHLALLAQSACSTLWWAIRRGVRAAQVNAMGDVERVVTSFAPRCLVIEPARLAIHESRQIFRTWRALGVHVPKPEASGHAAMAGEGRS